MHPHRRSIVPRTRSIHYGFTLVEALVAVAVTSIAGAALLTSLSAAVVSSTETAHRTIARGLAEQLLDEIAAVRFPAATNSTPSGSDRGDFDDIDDYADWSSRPPHLRNGSAVGTDGGEVWGMTVERTFQLRPDPEFLASFTRAVSVERVRPSNGGGWQVVSQHEDYRRVTVRVSRTDARGNTSVLAEAERIFSNVPLAP